MPTAAWSCVNVLSFRAAQSHIGYRGDYLSWRGLEGGRPIGVNLRRGGAANSSPPPCGEGLGVGVVRGGTALPQPPDPPPRPSPSRNRVYAGFGHSIKRSKSATADFDWGRETRRHCHRISQRLWEVRARQRAGKGGTAFQHARRGCRPNPDRLRRSDPPPPGALQRRVEANSLFVAKRFPVPRRTGNLPQRLDIALQKRSARLRNSGETGENPRVPC